MRTPLLALLLAASTVGAQSILPADPARSIVQANTSSQEVFYWMQVIPLEAFNAAVAAGNYYAGEDFPRTITEVSAGMVNEPGTLGITTTNLQYNSWFSATSFLVVKDARYVPNTSDMLAEATDYFFVTGHLYGQAAWVGSTIRVIQSDADPSTLEPFPAACCPAPADQYGGHWGRRCVNPATRATLSFAPEAASLPMGHAGHVPVYHLGDAASYPDGGTGMTFATVTQPPAGLAPRECLSCSRFNCVATGCASQADCLPGETCQADGGCGPSLVQCRSTQDCFIGQSCVLGRCLAGGAGAKACKVDKDCPLGQRCGPGGSCVALSADAGSAPDGGGTFSLGGGGAAKDGGVAYAPAPRVDGGTGGFNLPAYSVDLSAGLSAGGTPPQAPAARACPEDRDLTALHCLDGDFLESACGQRYSPAAAPPNHAPAGPLAHQCELKVAAAFLAEPKRNPAEPAPVTQRVCEAAPQGGATDGGMFALNPNAQQQLHNGGQVGPALVCRDVPVGNVPPYETWFQKYGALYMLDGRALSTRHPEYRPFQFDQDTPFPRSELHATGGTASLAAKNRKVMALTQDAAAARAAITEREDRWAGRRGPRKLLNCAEYAFQRFYDHSRFVEEAALLDDWGAWQLAFGPANLPTSVGTRVLDRQYAGPRDYLGNPLGNYAGQRIGHMLPGQSAGEGRRYFKNVFFSVILPPSLTDQDLPFAYRKLLRMAQDPTWNPTVGNTRIQHPDFRHQAGWTWNRDTGQALLDRGVTAKQFEQFTTGYLPRFISARDRLHRAIVEGLGPFGPGERYPERISIEACLSCACYHERWLLPWHYSTSGADRFFEWRDNQYPWGFVEQANALERFARSHDLGSAHPCNQQVSPELRAAAAEVERLMKEAELKGYLDLDRPTTADWNPRWFVDEVKALFTTEKEEAYALCKLYTNDDFATYEARMASIPGASTPLRDYGRLENSFRALEAHLRNLPEDVRHGTDWHAGDDSDLGSHGFGVNYAYAADLDVSDYTSNGLPSPLQATLGVDTSFDVGVTAFGIKVPLVEAGLRFDTVEGVELPVVRVTDFDLLDMARDFASDALGADDFASLVDNPLQTPAGVPPTAFDVALEHYESQLVSFEFSYIIPVTPVIAVRVSGGVGGSIGADVEAHYRTTAGGIPESFSGSAGPFAKASVFIEGGISAVVASVSIRTTIILVDFSLPLVARMNFLPNPQDASDRLLSFDVLGTGELEMLAGNVKLSICVGVWPFEYCYRKKLFQWDAAIHEPFTFFDLDVAAPVSVRDLALSELIHP